MSAASLLRFAAMSEVPFDEGEADATGARGGLGRSRALSRLGQTLVSPLVAHPSSELRADAGQASALGGDPASGVAAAPSTAALFDGGELSPRGVADGRGKIEDLATAKPYLHATRAVQAAPGKVASL